MPIQIMLTATVQLAPPLVGFAHLAHPAFPPNLQWTGWVPRKRNNPSPGRAPSLEKRQVLTLLENRLLFPDFGIEGEEPGGLG
jgi:hypothetical protein